MTACRLRIRGTVQGVGFRPFIFVLAAGEGLTGWVLNDGEGVEVFLEGAKPSLDRFKKRLVSELPPLAKIDSVEEALCEPEGFSDFTIRESQNTSVFTGIPADAAVCAECVRELTDKTNRRYRYPFINCTHCGPRYTITSHLPYDRPCTSMKDFTMCPACLKEYKDPRDRRFHAQPNACEDCGPKISLLDAEGRPIPCSDVIAETLARIKKGEIAAVKGIGGFHLVCDAANHEAVALLRACKHRPSKPFAVMVLNRPSAERFTKVSEAAEKELESPAAPIVLCPKKPDADTRLSGIAPRLTKIGIMFPYTPIHWLLFFESLGRPGRADWVDETCDLVLVMTSANASGEPLVTGNEEAVKSLYGIADFYLVHNRDILIRCDDSVAQVKEGADGKTNSVQYIRRGRGLTPDPMTLPLVGVSVAALGPYLKNTACLTKNNKAYLTQHIGDLDRPSNCRTLEAAVGHLEQVFEIRPQVVACDLHPDFYSTELAQNMAGRRGLELIPVQHHHAHVASVMAEHGLNETVLGFALDGVGLGDDGASWGCELLEVAPEGFERLASVTPLRLPGGDKCAREGWRMGYALLKEFGLEGNARRMYAPFNPCVLSRMLESSLPIATSSSLGRIFDAMASLLDIAHVSTYEGEAPALLQSAAEAVEGAVFSDNGSDVKKDGSARAQQCRNAIGKFFEPVTFKPDEKGLLRLNFAPMMIKLAESSLPVADRAYIFHLAIAEGLAGCALFFAARRGIKKICLSGGCALNTLLMRMLRERLEKGGLTVYENARIPPNDGGLALGQAWAAILAKSSESPERKRPAPEEVPSPQTHP